MCAKKKLSFIACLFGLILNQKMFCVGPEDRIDRLIEDRLLYGSNRSGDRDRRTLNKIEELKDFIDYYNKQIDKLEASKKELGANAEEIDGEIAKLKTELDASKDDFGKYRGLIRSKSATGVVLAKIFSGSDRRNQYNEDEINSWYAGLWEGLSVPLSEVMKDKAKRTIEESVGTVWDFFFDGFINFCGMVRNVVFHDTNEPFELRKLEGWQRMITTAYGDIEKMHSNLSRDSSRSLDSVSRQFEDNGGEVVVKKDIDMWAALASGYAEQFAYLATIFEQRQAYYDEDDIVVFYSRQICQMLQATCKLLMSSKSLKDLDLKLESQKTIIPAIRQNINNLLEQLKAEVAPKASSKPATASSASSYKSNQYSGAGYGNDPMSMANGGMYNY